jgi:DNA-binding MarR family transcriptional regulator
MAAQDPKTKYQPVCVCTNLRRATRAISNMYDVALASSGLKITQFSLLRAIERNEPVAITALAEEMALDRTTLARNLAPLQRDRLVELAPGSDQRVTQVRLTRAGRNAIKKALPLWKKTQLDVSRLLSDGRIEQLREIATEASAAAESFAAHRRR